MTLAERIDGLVDGRVIVFGSTPPEARDLDLLAREPELARLVTWLREEGFLERGGHWVRFHGCTADALDLVPASEWALPPAEEERLYAEAVPLEGLSRLVRPAPHHLLLLIARFVAEEGGRLSEKRRRKIEAGLAEDAEAWSRAREHADAWEAAGPLAALEAAFARPAEPTQPQPGRGLVVAFSGVDGSGKTSQIEALKATLARLGFDTVDEYVRIEWMTLTGNRALSAIAAPAKRVLGFRPRRGKAHSPSAGGSPPDSARELRRRSGFLTHAWVLVVALSHARVQRRATRRHLAAGRVVVCDRYTLDALVYLRYAYGERHRFRLQSRLIELLSPRPALAFHLDVPAETALARKHEQYGLDDLTRLARLYREEHGRLGVRLLDGERPREELCAEIGREAWLALSPGA